MSGRVQHRCTAQVVLWIFDGTFESLFLRQLAKADAFLGIFEQD